MAPCIVALPYPTKTLHQTLHQLQGTASWPNVWWPPGWAMMVPTWAYLRKIATAICSLKISHHMSWVQYVCQLDSTFSAFDVSLFPKFRKKFSGPSRTCSRSLKLLDTKLRSTDALLWNTMYIITIIQFLELGLQATGLFSLVKNGPVNQQISGHRSDQTIPSSHHRLHVAALYISMPPFLSNPKTTGAATTLVRGKGWCAIGNGLVDLEVHILKKTRTPGVHRFFGSKDDACCNLWIYF